MTTTRPDRPLVLPPNVFDHFYRGGARIAALRGSDPGQGFRPEEWLAATIARDGGGDLGLSRTGDGELLRDLVAGDPDGWLGGAGAWPGDTGVLVKLLDAAQRLPVHVHPTRSFARSHLNCPYGKTEAWYVLAADGTGADAASVWLGWQADVDPAALAAAVERQDSTWMLERMNRVQVAPGDGILVPAGTAHAIGAGVFVIEVQEPTDFSVLLEWSVTTSGPEDSHLGLGWDRALTALQHTATDPQELASLIRHSDPAGRSARVGSAYPAAADPFFRLQLAAPAGGSVVEFAAGYGVVVVLSGVGAMTGADAEIAVQGGEVLVVPAAFGAWQCRGAVRMAVARPGAGWPGALSAPDRNAPDRNAP